MLALTQNNAQSYIVNLLLIMENKNILSEIQTELKAPKGQRNNFGNYSYRSAEDILEAVKPLLAKHSVALLSNDDIVEVKDRVYVKTTVILIDSERKAFASATGWAREDEVKKGMDVAQITGSSASYSSKRALGNLLCISDSSLDPDRTNKHGKNSPATSTKAVATTKTELI